MIGALRNEITLLTVSRIADGAGGGAQVWSDSMSVFASVEQLTATSDIIGDRSVKRPRVAARIRRRSDLSLGGRFRFQGVDFTITSIEDADVQRRYVTLIGEGVI